MATGIKLAKYKIPKEVDTSEHHVFTSNANDEKELWHKSYGMRTLLESIANYNGKPLTPSQLRKYRTDPRVLVEWLNDATLEDFKKLRGSLTRMSWGVTVYNYLMTCWLVMRTKHQATLVIRLGRNVAKLTPKQQVTVLHKHLAELKKYAQANNYNMLWAFDHDKEDEEHALVKRKRVNSFHVHIYCSHKMLFTFCREPNNLLPFIPQHTVLTAVVPVKLPKLRGDGKIDWSYSTQQTEEGTTQIVPNTLAYAAAKTSCLHMKPNNSHTVTQANRVARYVKRIVNNSDTKNKSRRHWGYVGFGIKGS